MEPDWYKISYPYFWHPWKGIIVTVTIYLLVAISAERYRAVCHPLSRRHVSISLKKYLLSIQIKQLYVTYYLTSYHGCKEI